ncbi:MAG: hypothetical protein DWH78_13680 [Planctomycetota bacterium]|nr:MAG: hypothetical protein DWH78_13680 [Planctomycetota bacterium]
MQFRLQNTTEQKSEEPDELKPSGSFLCLQMFAVRCSVFSVQCSVFNFQLSCGVISTDRF